MCLRKVIGECGRVLDVGCCSGRGFERWVEGVEGGLGVRVLDNFIS